MPRSPHLAAALFLLAACGAHSSERGETAAGPAEPPPALRLDGRAHPTAYTLALTVSPSADTFQGQLTLSLAATAPVRTLWLHGEGLAVSAASLTQNGQTVPAVATPAEGGYLGFTPSTPLLPGEATLSVRYSGQVETRGNQGLFRQSDRGDAYLFTELEATDARRVLPCFDEPSFKVPWQLTLTFPQGLSAFSNTPAEREERDAAAGTHTVRFAKTAPLPSYLFAFAVGPFEVVEAGTAGRDRTPIRIITPRGKAAQAGYAASMAGQVLERLEAYFDLAHPFPKLDLVAVPGKRGAMENAGLITFGEGILLAAPGEQTEAFERRFAIITAHEVAHQWFGNLVTLRWWDEIWLNEAFAQWMETRIVRELRPAWAREEDAVEELQEAFAADELVSARKIRQPIETASDIDNVFDGITYAKGASVLRMIEAWVGPEHFQAGIRAYLKGHAGKTTVAADLIAALSASAGKELAPLFASYVDQPGVPLVAAELLCAAGPPTLTLSQRRYLDGKTGARACTLLTEASGTLPLPEAKGCPKWLAPNEGARGYYRVLPKGALLAQLLAAPAEGTGKKGKKGPAAKRAPAPVGVPAPSALSSAERLAVLDDAQALARSGELSVADALALSAREVREGEPYLTAKSVELAEAIEENLVPDTHREAYQRFVEKTYGPLAHQLGLKPKQGEDAALAKLRPTVLELLARQGKDAALQAQGKALAQKWLEDPSAVDPELLRPILALAAASGDAALYERLFARAQGAQEQRQRERLIRALSEFREPALVQRSLELLKDPAFDARELQPLLWGALRNKATQRSTYEYLKAHYAELAPRLSGPAIARLSTVGGVFCDPKDRQDVSAFFAPRAGAAPGGQRILAQTLERIDQCAVLKSRQQPNVAAFLSKY